MSDLKVAIHVTLKDGATKPLKGLTANLTGTANGAKAASANLGNIGKAATSIGAVTSGLGKAATATGQLGDEAKGAAFEISYAASAADSLGDAVADAAEKGSKGINKLIGDFGKLKAASSTAIQAGAAIAAVGAGMLGAAALPVKAAMDREAALTAQKMATMRQDGSNPIWDSMAPALASMRGKGKSDAQLGDIAGGLLAGGSSAGDISGGALASAVMLSKVGKLDGRATGELLAKLSQNAGVDDYGALADIAARGGHGANIDLGRMLSHLADLNYKGRELGLTGLGATQGYAKLLTGFSMAGMDGGASVSAMQSLIAGLPRIGEKLQHGKGWKTAEAAAIQQKYGLGNLTGQLFDGEGNIVGADGEAKLDNVIQIFHTINEKVGNAQDKMILFKEILGDSVGDAALNMDWALLNKANMKLAEQADLAAKAEKEDDTLAQKWAALRVSVGAFMSEAGEPLLGLAKGVIDKVTGVIGAVTEWTGRHPRLTSVVLGSIGIVGSLLVGVGGLVISVGLLGKTIASSAMGFGKWQWMLAAARAQVKGLGVDSMLASAKMTFLKTGGLKGLLPKAGGLLPKFAGVGGAFGFGGGGMFAGLGSASGILSSITSALAAIPGLGWAIAGAIALVAGVVYKYWEPIKGFFSGLWGGIKEGWEDIAGPAFGGLKEAALGIWNAFSSLLDIIVPLKAGQDGVNQAFGVGQTIGWAFMAVLKGIFTIAKYVCKGIEAVVIVVATMVDTICAAGKTIWYAVTGQWGKIGDTWRGVGSRAVGRLENSSMNPDKSAKEATKGMPPEAKAAPKAQKTEAGGQEPGGKTKAKGQQGGQIVVNYEPKIEIKGGATQEDRNMFMRQLEAHKEEVVRVLQGVINDNKRWMGA